MLNEIFKSFSCFVIVVFVVVFMCGRLRSGPSYEREVELMQNGECLFCGEN